MTNEERLTANAVIANTLDKATKTDPDLFSCNQLVTHVDLLV